MDPNALVRIIPLHSEDSYEGYGEDGDGAPPPPPLDPTMHDLGLPGGVSSSRPKKLAEIRKMGSPALKAVECPVPPTMANLPPKVPLGAAGSSRQGAGLRSQAGQGDGGPRAPGKVRPGPRRKVDPNALVRIIPLHSEDSYDGYSEDERPPPHLESPTEQQLAPRPPAPPKTPQPPQPPALDAASKPPASPLPPRSPQPKTMSPPRSPMPERSAHAQQSQAPPSPKAPQPPKSPQPPSALMGAAYSEVVREVQQVISAREGVSTQKVPGRPRGPRRKVDPNALVRIIPLHSEDSYEGYGEDDLPADLAMPKGPRSEGVDVIVDEIDMSKWREPSFEESEMVRIIPLKGDYEPPRPRAAPAPAKTKAAPAGGKGRGGRADASGRSPMMPPEEELVRIIPLHTPEEEKAARLPSRSPRSPLPSPGIAEPPPQAARSEPVRRRRRSEPKTQPAQGDELVKIIPLHSPGGDSDSETELAGYAAAAKAARERPRKTSDTRSAASAASRTGSRAGSASRASSRPGSARSERMEPLQIVPLTDPDCVEETGVCFSRRDLAIQQGRLTPSALDWHSHGRNTPQEPATPLQVSPPSPLRQSTPPAVLCAPRRQRRSSD